jgi:hypothetical protein
MLRACDFDGAMTVKGRKFFFLLISISEDFLMLFFVNGFLGCLLFLGS